MEFSQESTYISKMAKVVFKTMKLLNHFCPHHSVRESILQKISGFQWSSTMGIIRLNKLLLDNFWRRQSSSVNHNPVAPLEGNCHEPNFASKFLLNCSTIVSPGLLPLPCFPLTFIREKQPFCPIFYDLLYFDPSKLTGILSRAV